VVSSSVGKCHPLSMADFVSHLHKYRDECQDRVNEVSGACHRRCRTWQQAIDLYSKAYNEKRIKAVPQPGSIYWTTPVAPAPIVHSHEGRSRPSNSSDEYWNAVEENTQEFGADELSAYLGNINLQDW
jgi:hypothetical protein